MTATATAGRPRAVRRRPDLRHERTLLRDGAAVVVGMDEVGRGALAGPVSVGAVAVDLTTGSCPKGVADSKLLTAASRTALLPALGRWGVSRAVGHASAAEIDAIGIIAALRLAGNRALAALSVDVDVVLLDGNHDWLSTPGAEGLELWPTSGPSVRTRIKADLACASVAAASVLAKCERDALMVALAAEHPEYGWHENKGYGAPEHLAALRSFGPTALHRQSWRLPVAEGGPVDELDLEGLGAAVGTERPALALLLEDAGGLDDEVGPGDRAAEHPGRWSMMDA